jgi:putative acyl-CoA dehydrogenase
MMRSVLAVLALTMEGIVALVMRLCHAFDHAASDPIEAAHARLLTPVVKYFVCKRAPGFVYEAMECLGGNGYVEDSTMMGRLYREAPVNAIWEGSGNVMGLDMLRALSRDSEAAQQVIASLVEQADDLPGIRDMVSRIFATLRGPEAESHGRYVIEQLALLAACAALRRQAPPEIAESFAQSQLGERGLMYGATRVSVAETVLGRALAN